MKLSIAQKLHPFSHQNGTKFLLPQTSFCVQVYPTRLEFTDLEGREAPFFIELDFAGPVVDFTAELDLERGVLRIFGTTQKGYMRYLALARKDGIQLKLEKAPGDQVMCRLSSTPTAYCLTKGESLLVPMLLRDADGQKSEERLSLGMHKAQNWEFVRRRCDFKEIFPIWLALGHWVPTKETEGNYSLLEECRKNIETKNKAELLGSFQKLFLACFDGVLVPRLVDTEHQGIVKQIESDALPLPLLTKGASLIRSLFVQEMAGKIAILPCLPAEFHCGRMTGVQIDRVALDFEWSKKSLRRLRIVSPLDAEVCLNLRTIRSCRLRYGRGISKKAAIASDGSLIVSLAPNQPAFLDRFEK
jgi:hypothetical protein